MKTKIDKEVKYCFYCGAKNDKKEKFCKKCEKKLEEPHEIRDYFKTKIKEKYQDKVKDTFWSILENLIKSHLYGTVVTCSIIFTVTSLVVTSLGNNYVEKIKEPPTLLSSQTPRYAYAGEGLTGQEICDKYTVALENNDIATIKGLQLETFYPNVRKDLENYYNNRISSGEQWYNLPILQHDLVVNGHLYFASEYVKNDDNYANGNRSYRLDESSSKLAYTGKYNDYTYERYLFFMHDWSGVEFEQDIENHRPDSAQSSFYRMVIDGKVYSNYYRPANDIIELIEIDGNYYVNGEDASPFSSLGEIIDRKYILENYGGDINSITMISVHESELLNPVEYALQNSPDYYGILNKSWLDY